MFTLRALVTAQMHKYKCVEAGITFQVRWALVVI